MKKLVSVFLLICCISSFAGNLNSNKSPSKFSTLNLIFTQTSKSALLESINNRPGYYKLTLFNVDPYITYISERPNRIRGIVPTENFVKAWSAGTNNFAINHPNALIIPLYVDGTINKGLATYSVAIERPKFDKKKMRMQYILKPLATNLIYKHLKFDYVTIVIE